MTRRSLERDPTEEARTNADEVAMEFVKQLITLSSGVLALSATFIGSLPSKDICLLIVLAISWISLLTSIFFCLQTISTIIKSRLERTDEWSTGHGKTSAFFSKYLFLLGIGLFAIFAFISLLNLPLKS